MTDTAAPRRLPLHEDHLALGARMVETDGRLLPLEYTGVFQEYRAHRRGAVLWDASDLGTVRVAGPGAFEAVQRTFTNDLRRARPGRCQYTFLLDESDAGVVDDLMVWWVAEEEFVLTPSRPAAVLEALRSAAPAASCTVEDLSADQVLLALQGALAEERLADVAPEIGPLRRFEVRTTTIGGRPALVGATGFGGETGYEFLLPADPARQLLRRLLEHGVAPAGLAMRETHRMEAGIPRHGRELGPEFSPLAAGAGRAVALDTEFRGRAALLARSERGPEPRLRTVLMAGRQAPAPGSTLFADCTAVGWITSGNYSFRLHRGLGFAYLHPGVAVGSTVVVRTANGDTDGTVGAVPGDPEVAR